MGPKHLLSEWPVLKQIRNGSNGTGVEAMSAQTRNLAPKTRGAEMSRSVCPYCGVGCGLVIYHKDNQLVSIEGDRRFAHLARPPLPQGRRHAATPHPSRPVEEGEVSRSLCPRVARRSRSRQAMDMIADRVWETRERTFVEKDDSGRVLMHTMGIAHLGGATLDNEENYLIKKLFTAGLGMSCVSNQARI